MKQLSKSQSPDTFCRGAREVNRQRVRLGTKERGRRMKRKLINILGALALLTLFTTQVFAKEMTVQGRLQRTVEPGGWVIAAGNQKYLILNSQQFLNEKWFAEGNEIESSGETKPDVMTTFMAGTPFEVRTMRPLAPGGSGASQSGLI